MVFFSHFISYIISSQCQHLPMSADVSICLTPSPLCQPLSAFALPPLAPLSAIISILHTPPPLAADIICEQPLSEMVIFFSFLQELL